MVESDIFSQRLLEELHIKNISQRKLAKAIGIDPSLITRFIKNERTPTEATLIKIAYYLNINPYYLIGISDCKEPSEELKNMYRLVLEEEDLKENNKPICAIRIKYLLDINNLTQGMLAKHLHLSKSSISSYCRGVRVPNIEILKDICDFFNVSLDFIVGRTYIKNNDELYKEIKTVYNLLKETQLLEKISSHRKERKVFIEIIKKAIEIYN